FFVRAEDGIRDRNVTGVQTCALPILYGNNGGSIQHLAKKDGPLFSILYNIQRKIGIDFRSGFNHKVLIVNRYLKVNTSPFVPTGAILLSYNNKGICYILQ